MHIAERKDRRVMLVALQKGGKILIQLEVEAVKVNGGTIGGAAVIDYITADRAVKVNYSTTERQQSVGFNSSAVPALGSNSRLNIQSSIY